MTGYEIHLGVTQGPALAHPAALSALLAWAGLEAITLVDFPARREADLDRLADAVEAALDWGRLAGGVAGSVRRLWCGEMVQSASSYCRLTCPEADNRLR